MTDSKDTVRSYSQDRQKYRHNSISRGINTTTEMYSSNRNSPEILSVLALRHNRLENREKQIYRTVTNDTHHFHMINYPLQSPSTSPIPNSGLEIDNKQPTFPKLTPRSNSVVNKFPTLTGLSISSHVNNKSSMPTIRTSVKSTSSPLQKPLQTKMPIVSTEKKKKSQPPEDSRRRP